MIQWNPNPYLPTNALERRSVEPNKDTNASVVLSAMTYMFFFVISASLGVAISLENPYTLNRFSIEGTLHSFMSHLGLLWFPFSLAGGIAYAVSRLHITRAPWLVLRSTFMGGITGVTLTFDCWLPALYPATMTYVLMLPKMIVVSILFVMLMLGEPFLNGLIFPRTGRTTA